MDIYVDKEKRTTVAVMTNVRKDMYHYLESLISHKRVCDYPVVFESHIISHMILKRVPNVLRAKAKCSPEDNFSEDVGMNLARARLLEKYHSHCLSILLKYEEYVNKHLNDRLIAAINMMGDKLYADNGTLVDILDSTGALG